MATAFRGRQRVNEEFRQITEAIRRMGVPVNDFEDVVRSVENHPQVVPALLDYLRLDLETEVKEGVVRALTVPIARRSAARPLVEEFRRARDARTKWAIANALSIVSDDSVFEEIAGFAVDPAQGSARQMLAAALGRSRDPRAVAVLLRMLEDDQVAGHAITALRRLKPPEALPRLQRFLSHPIPWVRAEARRAVEAIARAQLARSL